MTAFSQNQFGLDHDRQTVEKLCFLVTGRPLLLDGKRIGLWHQGDSATSCAYFVNSSIWNTPKSKVRQPDKGRYFLDLVLVWYELERVFRLRKDKQIKKIFNHAAWTGSLANFLKIVYHFTCLFYHKVEIGVVHMSALCGSCLPVIVMSMLLLNPGLERFVTRCSPHQDLPPW